MAGILEYSTTPSSNTTINGIGISGSSSIKYGDDAIRQFMADVRSAVTKASDKAAGTHMATKADHNQLWRVTGTATINLTSAATLTAGWALWVMADGGTVTIDPASSEQINGAATLTIQDGAAAFIICTATAFRALPIGTGDMQSATWAAQITASLKYAGAIGAAQDLDTYTAPGIYTQNQISGASGGTNYPVANAGMLEVLDGGGATNVQTVQRYTEYSQPPIVWQRMRRNAGNWSAWVVVNPALASKGEAEAGTETALRSWSPERVAQAIEALAPPGFGVGQAWTDVTSSRAINTSYQNTTGKPIEVVIGAGSGSGTRSPQVSIDNASWITIVALGEFAKGSFVVPDGNYYRVSGSGSISTWTELR